MTTIDPRSLAHVTGGTILKLDANHGSQAVSVTRETGSFWDKSRRVETDDEGRPYAHGPSWRP